MNNDFNQIPCSAFALGEQEKHRKELELKEQLKEDKINKYNEDSINVAKDTRDIEKETLKVSKRTFWIATISLIVSIITLIITLSR